MLEATKRVQELYDNDEFKIFIIQGDHGYGKTSYANNIVAEANSKDGETQNWDIPLFKRHIGFHPAHVFDIWMNKRKRGKVFHWDDAGLWLNAMDYQDPFVKEVGKYLQVARSDWACIILSCIDREDIANKIRSLRHSVTVDITKHSNQQQPNRRKAEAVTYWKNKKGQLRWTDQWEEEFNCMMPDKFYNWYYPLRKKYSSMAKKLAKEKIRQKTDVMQFIDQDQKFTV